MNWLRNFIQKEIKQHDNKIKALEDYLDIEYFNGSKYKPHYRKRKTIAKKVGRPRKNK